MTTPDPIYCPAQTYARTRDTPAEYCDELVSDHGEFCDRHDEEDRADDLYDAWKEARYED